MRKKRRFQAKNEGGQQAMKASDMLKINLYFRQSVPVCMLEPSSRSKVTDRQT
jgi:hypothetical protein